MAGPPEVCGQPLGLLEGAQNAVTCVGWARIAIDGPGGACDPVGCSKTHPTFAASSEDDATDGATDGNCSLPEAVAGAFAEEPSVTSGPRWALEHPAPPTPKITRDSSHRSAVARRAPLRGRGPLVDALAAFRMQLVYRIRGARGVGLGSCRGNQTDRDSPYDEAITLAAGRHSRGYRTRCWLVTGPRPPFEIRTGSLLPSRGESVGLHVPSGAWLAADGVVGRRARLGTHPRRSDHLRRVSSH
jgi:hypothetical protein